MNTVVIDGVEYEELEDPCRFSSMHGDLVLYLRPLPPAKKTIVQVAAETINYDERKYRTLYDVDCAAYDAIEQRLQAIEKKLERSDAGGKGE